MKASQFIKMIIFLIVFNAFQHLTSTTGVPVVEYIKGIFTGYILWAI